MERGPAYSVLPQGGGAWIRAAEEPLRSDLRRAGLRAQVLERIEELEAREREAEEILSELVPAKEKRGYETVGRRQ
jgi:hypothetical protein